MTSIQTPLDVAVLKLGLDAATTDFSCQVSGAYVDGAAKTVAGIGTFCNPSPGDAFSGFDHRLNLGIVQDITDPAGLIAFMVTNAGKVVHFELSFFASGAKVTGQARVPYPKIGGDVGSILVDSKDWPMPAGGVFTPPAPPAP
jgi:hypothetical protein